MFIVNCERSFLYKILGAYFQSFPTTPVLAEIGVLEGDNASEILSCVGSGQIYLIDAWSSSGVSDYVSLNAGRAWTRPIDSLQGYFKGDIRSQSTFDRMFERVTNRFKDNDRVTIIRELSSEIDALREKGKISSHCDFAYVDAGHQYEAVLDDLVSCSGWVSPDGIIQCNDVIYGLQGLSQNLGVHDALNKFIRFSDFLPIILQSKHGGDVLLTRRGSKFIQYVRKGFEGGKIPCVELPNHMFCSARWGSTGLSFCVGEGGDSVIW